ncbi:MAG: hypothetical protein ABI980_12295, partial [Nitrospirota bacterium]
MKRRRFLTVMMGVLVFGELLGAADAPVDAQGVPTELPGVSQDRGKALPAAQRFVILPDFNSDAV